MERRRTVPDRELMLKLRVGAFVLLGLFLFAVFILTIGTRRRFFEGRYTLRAAFTNVEGLTIGAPVRLAGVTVGTVKAIRFSRDPTQKKLIVEMELDRRIRSRIREDSVASIGTIGLVGDKILEITIGSPDRKVLQPGSFITALDPPDYRRLLVKGDRLLENAVEITASLRMLLKELDEGKAVQEAVEALRTLKRIAASIERGRGLLPSLIYDEETKALLTDLAEASSTLKRLAAEIEKGEGLLHTLIYEDKGRRLLADLSRAVSTLEQAALRTEEAALAIEQVAAEVKGGEGLLATLLFDPRGREVVEDLRIAVQDLKAITGKLVRGEGTLGALLEDPTLYEDLSSLLRGARRSWILRTLIRSGLKKGEKSR